jgi:hypothetical protein
LPENGWLKLDYVTAPPVQGFLIYVHLRKGYLLMSDPTTTAELLARIRQVQESAAKAVNETSAAQFFATNGAVWSAADYFKHLLLSVKPFVKALERSPEKLKAMLGQSSRPSRSYSEVVAAYKQRLAEGIRAEDFDAVVPTTFRVPDGTPDEKSYLVEVWNDAHERLYGALESWTEADLDSTQVPHPAIGMLNVREMLYFTLHHNTLHWNDMQQAGV